ncbi:MAG: MFS transporter [Gemmatimonadales bacterium]
MLRVGKAGSTTGRARAGVPGWWPPGLYYGWALVACLGLTATVSYGVLSYAFAVFVTPMGSDLGWSKATITGGFSLGALVMGLAAVPLGHWVDRHGARGLMTAGSALATLMLLAWSRVQTVGAFYGLWGVMGLAMAAVFYEPAFAVVGVWFHRHRGRALTVLTFMGGFASIIFIPLAGVLVSDLGWRPALDRLSLVYAGLTLLPHAVVLRRFPSDLGLYPDGAADPPDRHAASCEPGGIQGVTSSTFARLAVAFGLSSMVTAAVSVHLIPLLLERGYALHLAGAAMGLLGLMALPGRLLFTPLGDRWPRGGVTAIIFGLQAAAGVVLLWSHSTLAVWTFVILFGAGFGAITPARAALVSELFGGSRYGRVGGVLALVVSVARAAGPIGASWIYLAGGGREHGYGVVLTVLAGLSLISAVVVARLDGSSRRHPVNPKRAAAALRRPVVREPAPRPAGGVTPPG